MNLLSQTEARHKLRGAIGLPMGTLVCLMILYMLVLRLSDSFYHLYVIQQIEQGVEQTLATIIHCRFERPSKGQSYYLCDYHYTIPDGLGDPQTYQGEGTYPTSFSDKKEKGDLITIVYARSDHSVSVVTYGRTHFNNSYVRTGIGIMIGLTFILIGLVGALGCGWASYWFIKDWLAFQAIEFDYQETPQPMTPLALLRAFLFENKQEGLFIIIGGGGGITLFLWLFFTGQIR